MDRQESPSQTRSADEKPAAAKQVQRISSRELLGGIREIEIDHEGRIYRLRLTQANKLILTA
jgi:hemin uptake protein HemP